MGRTTRKTPLTTQRKQKYAIRWVFPLGVERATPLNGSTMVGREPPSDPCLDSTEVSRRHAQFETGADGALTVTDLGSTNGVYLNGALTQRSLLAPGDVLRLGNYVGVVVLSFLKDGDKPDRVSEWRVGDRVIWGGRSMRAIMEQITRLAGDERVACLNIEGELGTGAKSVAMAFHHAVASRQRGKARPFVAVDCSALRGRAREVLFGHWTGELGHRRPTEGLVFGADNGTIFFEEVTRLPLAEQELLLTLIDAQQTAAPSGADSFRARFVFTSTQPISTLAGELHGPLLQRLRQKTLRIPALREHREEIPQLVQRMISAALPRERLDLEPKLIETLCVYRWPENLRQLERVVRALIEARKPGEALARKSLRDSMPDFALEPVAARPTPASPVPQVVAPASEPIVRILFLTSSPAGKTALNVGKELRDIRERMRRAPQFSRFVLREEFAVRRKQLIEFIQLHRPTIVHFSGHGNEDGELMFETEGGGAAPAPVAALEEIFRILSPEGIRCVVLNACFSERQAKAIARHVGCVVGMGNRVSDAAAIDFAGQFYSSIALGSSIRRAFDLALAQLDLVRNPQSDIPQLLHREDVMPEQEKLL